MWKLDTSEKVILSRVECKTGDICTRKIYKCGVTPYTFDTTNLPSPTIDPILDNIPRKLITGVISKTDLDHGTYDVIGSDGEVYTIPSYLYGAKLDDKMFCYNSRAFMETSSENILINDQDEIISVGSLILLSLDNKVPPLPYRVFEIYTADDSPHNTLVLSITVGTISGFTFKRLDFNAIPTSNPNQFEIAMPNYYGWKILDFADKSTGTNAANIGIPEMNICGVHGIREVENPSDIVSAAVGMILDNIDI